MERWLRLLLVFSFCLGLSLGGWAEQEKLSPAATEFTVMAYNVENLFDLDRVASYDDYIENPADPNSYGPEKLKRKLKTITTVLKKVNGGKGPEVAILNELEV